MGPDLPLSQFQTQRKQSTHATFRWKVATSWEKQDSCDATLAFLMTRRQPQESVKYLFIKLTELSVSGIWWLSMLEVLLHWVTLVLHNACGLCPLLYYWGITSDFVWVEAGELPCTFLVDLNGRTGKFYRSEGVWTANLVKRESVKKTKGAVTAFTFESNQKAITSPVPTGERRANSCVCFLWGWAVSCHC